MKHFKNGIVIVLLVYFAIFICLFGITTIRKFFSKAYIVLDSGDKWMLENTKWVTLPDSENKLYNWQKVFTKPATALPFIITPASFHLPNGVFILAYSSAIFIPPVKATTPSITVILR